MLNVGSEALGKRCQYLNISRNAGRTVRTTSTVYIHSNKRPDKSFWTGAFFAAIFIGKVNPKYGDFGCFPVNLWSYLNWYTNE